MNVWNQWIDNTNKHPDREAVVHWVTGESPYRWVWKDLLSTASSISYRLSALGVKKGDVCALIIRHHKYFYPLYMAISGLDAVPAVLAYPNPRLHPDKFRQGLEGMMQRSGLDWVLTERDLEDTIRPLMSVKGNTIIGILFPFEWADCTDFPSTPYIKKIKEGNSPCLLQHSSGTTGLQKAVVLSHKAVLDHIKNYSDSIKATPEDRIVSWLPLYHDMGLIAAFYLPLLLGIPLVQLDPFEWVMAPVVLLEAISKERGTLTWLPNFAYNLMADRIRDEVLEGIRLDSVRMVVNCSEPVRSDSHERFYRRFAPFGLRRDSLAACYAMAETTFAVTQTLPGIEANKITVSREDIAKGTLKTVDISENSKVCVSSGIPIPGCEIKIMGEIGENLPPASIGEIVIKSVSLFDGYRNNEEATVKVMKDGWYYSGDYGFLHDGELYVIGRKKDIIIVAGKNIYPEDIEDAVSQVENILPGRVIAFGSEDEETGTEQIFVVAETAISDEIEKKRLRLKAREAGMAIDVSIARVYLAPPRWLIKSSSGKPSRSANRVRTLNELTWR